MRKATLWAPPGSPLAAALRRRVEAARARIEWEEAESEERFAASFRTTGAAIRLPGAPLPSGETLRNGGLSARFRFAGDRVRIFPLFEDGEEDLRAAAHAAFTWAAMNAGRGILVAAPPGRFREIALETARDYAWLTSEAREDPGDATVVLSPATRLEALTPGEGRDGMPEALRGERAAVFQPAFDREPAVLPSAALLLEHLNEHQACDSLRRAHGTP